MKKGIIFATITLLAGVCLIAHPHIQKSVDAKLGEVDIKLSFYTSPANMDHVNNAADGAFSTGYARLSLSGDLTVGGTTIPAGEYTVGAIKNGPSDWTMALSPGKLGYGEQADMSKLIKLTSSYSASEGTANHVNFDISPGRGSQEGQATLIWHYGTLFLSGSLTDKAE